MQYTTFWTIEYATTITMMIALKMDKQAKLSAKHSHILRQRLGVKILNFLMANYVFTCNRIASIYVYQYTCA